MTEPRQIERSYGPLGRTAILSARLLLVLAAIAVIGLILNAVRIVVVPLLAAAVFAAVLSPAVDWLHRHRVPRVVAAVGCAVGSVVVIVGIFTGLVLAIARESGQLVDRIEAGFLEIDLWLERNVTGIEDSQLERIYGEAISLADGLLGSVVAGLGSVVELFVGATVAIVMLVSLLKDGRRIWEWILSVTPAEARPRLAGRGPRVWVMLRRYFAATAVVGATDALFCAIALLAIGVPLVGPLTALFFFGAFVPYLGAFVAGAAAVVVALSFEGFAAALIMLIAVVAIQTLDGNIVGPLAFGRAVRIHPLGILCAVLAGGAVAGVLGAVFAVPIVATAQTFLARGD